MFRSEVSGRRAGFIIGDQIDPALPPKIDMLGSMTGDMAEPQSREDRLKNPGPWRRKFNEFKTIQADGIVSLIAHGISTQISFI